MTGVSAHERDIRSRLDEHDATERGDVVILVPASVLRGVLRDLEMWRRLADNEQALRKVEAHNPRRASLDVAEEREAIEAIEMVEVMDIIALLPDDKEKGLRLLGAARRMVEAFKR